MSTMTLIIKLFPGYVIVMHHRPAIDKQGNNTKLVELVEEEADMGIVLDNEVFANHMIVMLRGPPIERQDNNTKVDERVEEEEENMDIVLDSEYFDTEIPMDIDDELQETVVNKDCGR